MAASVATEDRTGRMPSPKVELHVHLDGAFDEQLLFEAAKTDGGSNLPESATLPWTTEPWPVRGPIVACQTLDEFHTLVTCKGKRSLREMIKCFELFTPGVQGRLDVIEQLAFRFVAKQAAHNVVYTEVRYNPQLLCSGASLGPTHDREFNAREIVETVTRGLRRGCEQYPEVVVNQLLCALTYKPEWSDELVALAHELREAYPCAVVGVDIAAGEDHLDPLNHRELFEAHRRSFRRAQELGLNITLHAGEDTGAENVKLALDEFGAQRIGHGYRLLENPTLVQEMVERGVHFECCPTSSFETGGWTGTDWSKHPIKTMIRSGLRVGLNTDDPQVFATDITAELDLCARQLELTAEEIAACHRASIDAAFCSPEIKAALRAKFGLA